LNQGCVLVHDLESMLLRDPPQNRFSTVSVKLGRSAMLAQCPLDLDLPLNFHPAAIRATVVNTPSGAV
jgi:hypothetical protein